MADGDGGGGGGWGIMGVIIGALLVVVIGFFVVTQTGMLGGGKNVQVDINAPKPGG